MRVICESRITNITNDRNAEVENTILPEYSDNLVIKEIYVDLIDKLLKVLGNNLIKLHFECDLPIMSIVIEKNNRIGVETCYEHVIMCKDELQELMAKLIKEFIVTTSKIEIANPTIILPN